MSTVWIVIDCRNFANGKGVSIFPTSMSVKITTFPLNSLRFDDATTRASRRAQDKFQCLKISKDPEGYMRFMPFL